MNKQKCAVIGCGFVGASIAFSLIQEEMFSELVLIDINQTKAEGEAMDLSHGLPFVHPMKIYAGTYADLADCFLIIITAGAGQRPGETRLELVRKNVEIFRDMIPQITAVTQDARLLIVSNPVDVMTYAAWKLSGYPPEHVIGSGTVLDTARLKYLLGAHLGVDSRSVHALSSGSTETASWLYGAAPTSPGWIWTASAISAVHATEKRSTGCTRTCAPAPIRSLRKKAPPIMPLLWQ